MILQCYTITSERILPHAIQKMYFFYLFIYSTILQIYNSTSFFIFMIQYYNFIILQCLY